MHVFQKIKNYLRQYLQKLKKLIIIYNQKFETSQANVFQEIFSTEGKKNSVWE